MKTNPAVYEKRWRIPADWQGPLPEKTTVEFETAGPGISTNPRDARGVWNLHFFQLQDKSTGSPT